MHAILLLAATLWWSVFHPVDLDAAYMKRVADKAAEYGDVAGFEVCGDCHSPYGGINGLSLLEPYPAAHAKVDADRVRKTRADLNEIVRIAHAAGKPLVYWHREVFLPEGLLEDVPALLDADGEFDLLGAAYERYLRFKIAEAFRWVPDLDGLVLTITEADFSVIHNSRPDRYPPAKVVERMTRIFAEELGRRGKLFTLRSFGSVARDYEDILAGAARAAKDHRFEIETKVTPYDFDPFLPDNPFLRGVPGTTLAAECDGLGEFFGAGYLPFAQAEAIGRYVSAATRRGVSRFAVRIDRVGNSIFDTAQEANLFCYSRLVGDPSSGADAAMSAWAARRWPGCEAEMLRLAKLGFAATTRTLCADGHVAFHQNPVAPTFKFIKAGGIFSVFRNDADLHLSRDLWGVLADRRTPGRAAILAEKDEAVRLAEEGAALLASVAAKLDPAERARQERAWRTLVSAAKTVRAFARCAAAYFDDMDARRDDPTALRAAVAAAERTIEPMMANPRAGVADFDLEHSRAAGQDLDRVYFVPFLWLCREFLNEYRVERGMRRALEADGAVLDFVIPGGIYDDNRVARAMHGAYAETKADRVVRFAGNRVFPNGTLAFELKAPADARIEVALDPDGPRTCAVAKGWTNGVWRVTVAKTPGAGYPGVLSVAAYEGPRNVDSGRQLFVDDWLVASTDGVHRVWNAPQKYEGNPVLWPETDHEREVDPNPRRLGRWAPCAVATTGGLWWDPHRRVFRLWYESGWMHRLSYAESADGVAWTRPDCGYVPGTNLILTNEELDTWTVFPDYAADDPYARWCLMCSPAEFARKRLYDSPDGLGWNFLGLAGFGGDHTTMFHDPFRGKWVFSVRSGPTCPGRTRSRVESPTFGGPSCLWSWDAAHDTPDLAGCPRPEPWVTSHPKGQVYAVDCVPYESLMLGVVKVLKPEKHDNFTCMSNGMPKATSLHFAFSRDGRTMVLPDGSASAIPVSGNGSGRWDSGYLSIVGGICVIRGERLWFYYSGFRGDASETSIRYGTEGFWRFNGMHFNGSIGMASLRRDGFAGMVADGNGALETKPLVFSGGRLFVNAECRFGSLAAEVLDADGAAVPGFAAADCRPLVRTDSTKAELRWKGADLSSLAGRPVRLRFLLHCGTLYSFWVSRDASGKSGGYVAAGGPDYPGLRDL